MTQQQAPEVTSELLPCPWPECDGARVAVEMIGNKDGWQAAVECDCGARGPMTPTYQSDRMDCRDRARQEATRLWNTRATQPLSLTVDEIMTIARLREVLAKCPALPIAARPQEHDDWGVIRSLSRNEEGYQPVFARAYSGRYETDIELNAHRRAKTDPTQDTMDLIVEGLNALPVLLDRLQSLSLPVDIDRSGLAQEVE